MTLAQEYEEYKAKVESLQALKAKLEAHDKRCRAVWSEYVTLTTKIKKLRKQIMDTI